VAGYPEAHPDFIVDDEEQMKKNYWDSLDYLKQKVGGKATGTCGLKFWAARCKGQDACGSLD
jgi:hypothetical protein